MIGRESIWDFRLHQSLLFFSRRNIYKVHVHTRTCMATKTLTITEDAYERLAMHKGKNDSFSDVIVKQFPKHSLSELIGILSHKEAEELRAHIRGRRKASRERVNRIIHRLQ